MSPVPGTFQLESDPSVASPGAPSVASPRGPSVVSPRPPSGPERGRFAPQSPQSGPCDGPRERLARLGPRALADSELVSLLLRTDRKSVV